MSPVRFTMFLAFTHMAVGSVWLLAWVPRRTIGVNFYRLMTVCAVILIFLAMLARYPAADLRGLLRHGAAASAPGPSLLEFWTMLATLAACIAFMLSVVRTGSDRIVHACGIVAGGVGAAAVLLPAYEMRHLLVTPTLFPLLALSFLLGALALGGVAVGMNLGHWYLMARLPLQPLQRVSTVLLAVLVAQSACTALLLLFCQHADRRDALLTGLKLESFDGIFVWLRLVVGLAFPVVLAYMIRDTARSGSTMSATGLLYIALLTVFAGEAASRFLLLTTGLWL